MTATTRTRRLGSVLGAALALLSAGAASAQASADATTVTRADLRGSTLSALLACREDGAVTLRGPSRTARVARLTCRAGKGRVTFRVTRGEAAAAASTRGATFTLRPRGSTALELEFQRPGGPARRTRPLSARAAAVDNYWYLAFASCHAVFGIRELGFHTNRALFASRVATPIGWRGGGYFYNEVNGAQGYFFNPRYKIIAAGFPDMDSITPGSRVWVRPIIDIQGLGWNYVNIGSVQGAAQAYAPNWCYFQ